MTKKYYQNVEIILFEGNPAYNEILSNSGFQFFNIVLSNPGREYVDFYNGTNNAVVHVKQSIARRRRTK